MAFRALTTRSSAVACSGGASIYRSAVKVAESPILTKAPALASLRSGLPGKICSANLKPAMPQLLHGVPGLAASSGHSAGKICGAHLKPTMPTLAAISGRSGLTGKICRTNVQTAMPPLHPTGPVVGASSSSSRRGLVDAGFSCPGNLAAVTQATAGHVQPVQGGVSVSETGVSWFAGNRAKAKSSHARVMSTSTQGCGGGSAVPRVLPRGNEGGRGPSRTILVLCAGAAGLGLFLYAVSEYVDELPESVDWQFAPGGFPDVIASFYNSKCGSCWAIATIKSVEAVLAIETGVLLKLSVQQIVDCAVKNGCQGAYMDIAYDYMVVAGITTEAAYPGTLFNRRCQMKGKPIAVQIDGYEQIYPSEENFMRALQVSPIAVYIHVNEKFGRHTGDEILELEDFPPCEGRSHCVLLVGYDKDEEGNKFWKIQNTWGGWWGKGGYGKLRRGCSDPRGVAGITAYVGYRPILRMVPISERYRPILRKLPIIGRKL